MQRSRVRVALVGCGGIAALYRGIYATSPLSQPVAFVDRDLETARAAARACGAPESAAGTELDRALADNVDAVVVNTPNHLHLEHGLAVIGADKHLLMQKPLAATLDDAERLASAARTSTRVNAMYLSFLDQPLVHELRGRIAAGDFGTIAHVHARYMHRGGIAWSAAAQRGEGTWRSSVLQTGGGCFIQLGIHYVHLISWLTGEDPLWVRGYMQNASSPGIEGEDVASALFFYPSGMVATIDTAWITEGQELTVNGSADAITYLNERWLFTGSSPMGTQALPPAMDDVENPHNGHRAFLESIVGLREIPVPLERGLHEMRAVDAFYRAARTDREVLIEQGAAASDHAFAGDR
jgi:predicted dehydrogenase